MKKEPLAFVVLKTQFSNAGDALIIREMLRMIQPYMQVRGIGGEIPQSFSRELELQPQQIVSLGWLRLTIASIASLFTRRAVYVFLAPGDPGGGVSLGSLLKCVLFPVLSILGTRIIRLGFSLGRLTSNRMKVESWLSKWCYFQGIRDELSLKIANDNFLSNIGYFPDLSFNLIASQSEIRDVPLQAPTVAISFRGDNMSPEEKRKTITGIISHLRELDNPRVVGVVQVDRDLEFVQECLIEIAKFDYVTDHEVTFTRSLENLSKFYRRCDVVLTNRLHVFLLAAANGSLPIALIGQDKDKKIDGILRTVKLEGFFVDVISDPSRSLKASGIDKSKLKDSLESQRDIIANIIPGIFQERSKP